MLPRTPAPQHPRTRAPQHPCTHAPSLPSTPSPLHPLTLAPTHPRTLAPQVALKDDEETVIASGETLEEAQERATEKGAEDPIFTRVPEESLPFVG